jgi:hypothetical protein
MARRTFIRVMLLKTGATAWGTLLVIPIYSVNSRYSCRDRHRATGNQRGHYLGKRFSNLRWKLGPDSQQAVFHSFRNALAQRCEDKEVPESTTELIGGWSRGRRMSYGLYSPGPNFETLRRAIAKVSYGEVDDLVRTLGARVAITKVSKRRVRSRAGSAVPKHRHKH